MDKSCCIILCEKDTEKTTNWWVFLLNFEVTDRMKLLNSIVIQSEFFPCPLCILMIIQVISKWLTIIEAAHYHIAEQRRLKQACGLVHTQYERCNQPSNSTLGDI